jgi:NAD(P)-dependent dehydrogenase (short-subunit alcohol dehydrogenase family)
VTGASTGIGREIALRLAASGVRVAASARSFDKLASLGSGIAAYPLDVTNSEAVAETVKSIESELGPVDLAIFGAGMYVPVSAKTLEPAVFDLTMSTNYMGVVNCMTALLPAMAERGHGHLSWIASVAGYTGLPKAAAYGPSKAALINLAESLKPELARMGIKVSVINPGFVETPMTAQNDFTMPFLMKPGVAAHATLAGLKAGHFEITFPRRFTAILKLVRLLPYSLYFRLVDRVVLK